MIGIGFSQTLSTVIEISSRLVLFNAQQIVHPIELKLSEGRQTNDQEASTCFSSRIQTLRVVRKYNCVVRLTVVLVICWRNVLERSQRSHPQGILAQLVLRERSRTFPILNQSESQLSSLANHSLDSRIRPVYPGVNGLFYVCLNPRLFCLNWSSRAFSRVCLV